MSLFTGKLSKFFGRFHVCCALAFFSDGDSLGAHDRVSAEDTGAILRLGKQFTRNSNVSVDGPEWNVQTFGDDLTPSLRLATGIFVANQNPGVHLFEKFVERVIRRTPHDERNVALRQIGFDIWQALVQENVMSQICIGKVGDGRKINEQRKAKFIGDIDGTVDSGIVEAPLGTLHPVHDACAAGLRGAASPNRDARIVGEFLECFG